MTTPPTSPNAGNITTEAAPTGELVGLDAAIDYVDNLGKYCLSAHDGIAAAAPDPDALAQTCQQSATTLQAGGVRGETLASVEAVQSSVVAAAQAVKDTMTRWETAATAAQKLHGRLSAQTTVQEAYTASPDAGSREFLTNADTTAPSTTSHPSPSPPGSLPVDDAPMPRTAEGPAMDSTPPYTTCEACGGPLEAPTTDPETLCRDCTPPVEEYTTCGECGRQLPEPTTDPHGVCRSCDITVPPDYWFGALTPDGKKVDPDQAEGYKTLEDLAVDVADSVLEWDAPYGEEFISFPDGSVVDAREWIERPENRALAGNDDLYAGRGVFDPNFPARCWLGQTLPSGGIARPSAKAYDDVAELARDVCAKVFDQLTIGDDQSYTVMLPGGDRVDAYEWAQQPATRQLGGCTRVFNRVQFRATAMCPSCGTTVSAISEQVIWGEIGKPRKTAAALYCDACSRHLTTDPVLITLVDDASGLPGAPARPIGDLDHPASPAPDSGASTMAGSTPTARSSGADAMDESEFDPAALVARLRATETVDEGAAHLRELQLDRERLLAVATASGLTRVDRLSKKALEERVIKQTIGARRKFEGLQHW